LKLLKEGWLTEEPPTNLLDHVSTLRSRLAAAGELAQKNLKSAQNKMKLWYDRKAKLRKFKVGDKVLVLLPLQNHTLQAKYSGPYLVSNSAFTLAAGHGTVQYGTAQHAYF